MTEKERARARDIAQRHLATGDALGWFEALYAQAAGDATIIPWADLMPNQNVIQWLEQHQVAGAGREALKIGCGLGDDAEELARRGFRTTAFDISASAIAWCRRRFPQSPAMYVVADLFRAPIEWRGKFTFVLESYTLQVLPPSLRREAINHIASFVTPRGTLLVVSRGREPDEPQGEMPWPLMKDELTDFLRLGLKEVGFEDYLDDEDPPVRRFRVAYRRER
ncbi:MAG: class I SAM-dependent methyltransferase [Deltaproteobacteria bacterium]|nr:class I SAM-dependent methyltransferase [Deltaproteobacteria bacterium]